MFNDNVPQQVIASAYLSGGPPQLWGWFPNTQTLTNVQTSMCFTHNQVSGLPEADGCNGDFDDTQMWILASIGGSFPIYTTMQNVHSGLCVVDRGAGFDLGMGTFCDCTLSF